MAIDPRVDPYVLRGRVVTMASAPSPNGVIDDGAVYIQGDTIADVAPASAPRPPGFSNAATVRTGGTIYPGLIELHNHLSYNAIPLWQVDRAYMHSGHWQGTDAYKRAVTKPVTVLANTAGNAEALVRYVECRCLLGGVTTSQGITLQSNAGVQSLYRGLVRNVETAPHPSLNAAQCRIGEPDKDPDVFLAKLVAAPDCYLQHLSEGINDGVHDTAIKQFTRLRRSNGTWGIAASLCGVHSTALERAHFDVLAAHGGSIVWSPLSNYLLYGDTTTVAEARAAGVPIALGSDWAPSGTKNLLGELTVAAIVSDELGGLFSARELCEMVTTTPARILRWESKLGTLGAGKLADLIVIAGLKPSDDPFEKLIEARETSLTLVVIGGIPRVGQSRLMKAFGAGGGEQIRVGGAKRILDLTPEPGDVVLGVGLGDAQTRLADTLRNLPQAAQDLDDAVAAGWTPGVDLAALGIDEGLMPPGWEEPRLRVVLEFEEEASPAAFLEALRAGDLADWVEPMELAGLTVPDDSGFLTSLMHSLNLPRFIKEELPGMHGSSLAVPDEATLDVADEDAAGPPDHRRAPRLRDFVTREASLSRDERQCIVEQAIVLLESYYVHLPMKRTMHAVDPIQRLRNLSYELAQGGGEGLSDLDFHREIIAVFDSLRDLHTTYRLPRPFRGKVAWLPYVIEAWVDRSGDARFIVSKRIGKPGPKTFVEGVEVLHWNGIPIARYVARLAQTMPGGNAAARWARAMNSLTLRSLTRGQIPDEDWVRLGYRTAKGTTAYYEQPWLVFEPRPGFRALSPERVGPVEAAGLGLDDHTDDLQHAKRVLLAADQVREEQALRAGLARPRTGRGRAPARGPRKRARAAAGPPKPEAIPSNMPTVFRAQRVFDRDGSEYGYLRIFTFNVHDPDEFIDEMARLLGTFSPAGLIIDVRGNGGGLIYAAERALELLSPQPVEPEPAQFIVTPATLRLAENHDRSTRLPGLVLRPWLASMQRSVASGATHSLGFPITPPDTANARGQRYQGPKVLIVDALCYSAADMFIAGFADHELGHIIGLQDNTGAGGANVWSHRLLRYLAAQEPDGGRLTRLPRGADLRTAVRRTLRVRANAGELVEDFGIRPDRVYRMTKTDLLRGNRHLIQAAIDHLRAATAYGVSVERRGRTLRVVAPHADAVRVTSGGRPVATRDLRAGRVRIGLPIAGARQPEIEIVAYADGRPVARTRHVLSRDA